MARGGVTLTTRVVHGGDNVRFQLWATDEPSAAGGIRARLVTKSDSDRGPEVWVDAPDLIILRDKLSPGQHVPDSATLTPQSPEQETTMLPMFKYRVRYRFVPPIETGPFGGIQVKTVEADDEAGAGRELERQLANLGPVDVIEASNEGPSRMRVMAARIKAGQCVVTDGWCLTHDVAGDPGHAHDIDPSRSLD